MKIAVTYDQEQIFQHFGQSKFFKIYEVADSVLKSAQIISAGEKGHGELAKVLQANDVNILICGGIGAGAQTALGNVGIEIYAGIVGSPDEAVDKLLQGTLPQNKNATCNHHDHHHDHGEHGCGGH